jgi:spore germination protein YaaH
VARRRRSWPARVAAPAAFLLAATVAVLLVRDGLRRDTAPTTTTIPVTTTRIDTGTGVVVPRYYRIRDGDTLSLVAERFGTTVDQLLLLNPGVDATDLTPGRRLRIQ